MDTSTWIAIVTVCLGVFSALLKIVWDLSQKRLDTLEESIGLRVSKDELDALRKSEIEALKKSLDNIEEQIRALDREHEMDGKDIYKTVESIRESLADARETIAGFGSTYVTRKEFYDDRK